MSDEHLRYLEHRYLASGDPADGEAWAQAVLRGSDVLMPLLRATIQATRAIGAIYDASAHHSEPVASLRAPIMYAVTRPVLPEDIVGFMRGTAAWAWNPEPPIAPPPTPPMSRAALARADRAP